LLNILFYVYKESWHERYEITLITTINLSTKLPVSLILFPFLGFSIWQKSTSGQKPPVRTRITKKPTVSSCRYPFRFKVYFDPANKRYFFPQNQSGCPSHKGHVKLEKHQIVTPRHTIGADFELIMQQLKVSAPTDAIRALYQERTGSSLTPEQLQSLRQLGKDLIVDKNSMTSKQSPADKLLAKLQADDNIVYQYLLATWDEKDLITIRQTKKDGKILREDPYYGAERSVLGDGGPRQFVNAVLKAMSLKNEQSLLLAIAWVTKDARSYFQMFPSSLSIDVTMGTNAEKRPLARATCRTSDKRNVPFFDCFLSSGSAWVWYWLFYKVFPALLPSRSLSQVILLNTTSDSYLPLPTLNHDSAKDT
jgi:hypothetical protein